MRSLLRNDLRWAWPLALLGTLVTVLSLALEHGAIGVWILPQNKYVEIALVIHAIGATLVAWWALTSDELLRTREYRLHRPQSTDRIFWARHLVGLAVVASWVLLSPSLHLLGSRLLSANAALIDSSRWLWFLVQGVPAFLFYALAVLLASCTQSILGGLALSVLGGGTLLAVAWMALLFGSVGDTYATVAASLLLTPLLLLLATRNHRQGRDPDRPWTGRRLGLAGTGLVAVALVVGSSTVTLWQAATRLVLLQQYPLIAARPEGATLIRWSDDDRLLNRVDEQHRSQEAVTLPPSVLMLSVAGGSNRWAAPQPMVERSPTFPGGYDRFRGESYRFLVAFEGPERRYLYLSADGYLTLFRAARLDGKGEDRPWMKRVGKAPDGRPFSPASRVLPIWNRAVLVVDPQDGDLWAYDVEGAPASFSPRPLPDGDRLQRLVVPKRLPTAGTHARAALPLVVQGDRGTYAWEDGRFVPTTPSELGADTSPTPRLDIQPQGPLGLQVSWPAPSGAVFHHLYQPRTGRERTIALLHRGSTLLRPPLLTLPGVWASGPDRAFELGPALLLDRPVVLGDRAGLAAGFALSLLLAALSYRRLGKLGASPGRRRYWTVAIALGGVPAWLCCRFIELPRAWQPMPAEPEGRPALLLQTA